MENKRNNILKTIVTILLGLFLSTGVVFAGTIVYEKIWKTPEKIEISSGDLEEVSKITEEARQENISEEEAKEIAINKLNEIEFNANIVKTRHYKEFDSNRIIYRFDTEGNFEICIDGQTGKFTDLWNYNDIQDCDIEITEQEAIETANYYCKLFGIKGDEYNIVYVWSNNKEGSGKGPGYKIDIEYGKKYGELNNPYEKIYISIESKNKNLAYFRIVNNEYDNNELIITEEEATNIALEEEKKISFREIESTKANLMIVKMNADAYDRVKDIKKYYESKETSGYPNEERNYYKVDNKIRKAWVVVITYKDDFGEDTVKRYTEGKYSYFIDSTTGEIIGGHVMDYSYSDGYYNN